MSKSDTPDSAKRDYRGTLFLPNTPFPMKAGLPDAEPKWLARWEEMGLYERLRQTAKGRPLFVYWSYPPGEGERHFGALGGIAAFFTGTRWSRTLLPVR